MAETFDWTPRQLAIDEPLHLALGMLQVDVQRVGHAWAVEHQYAQDRYVTESSELVTHSRIAMAETGPALRLRPRVPARNIVARPTVTLSIPARESTTLYLGVPVWLELDVDGDAGPVILFDAPVEILSDTWFGANTRDGLLCYANETQARMVLEQLPPRPDRMVVPVNIINKGLSALVIDRLSLPVPTMSVFTVDGRHWAQETTITCTSDLRMADIDLHLAPPASAGEATLVSGPRVSEHRSVRNTIESLFALGR